MQEQKKSKKQLVAFLDLMGFSHYYDMILRQKNEDSKLVASAVIGQLYRSYMSRLKNAISMSYEKMANALNEQDRDLFRKKFDSVLNPHIISFSDSIIIAIDCREDEIVTAYMLLANALLLLCDETMKPDYMPEDLKKYNLSIFCPIRGGISYDYAELSLNERDPMIYGLAFYRAHKIESKAGWPRIVIDKELSHILSSNRTCIDSLSDSDIKGEFGTYLDILKMKYKVVISRIANIEAKRDVAQTFANIHKKYIELNARQASMLCKYGYTNVKNLKPKYESWIENYNQRIQWGIDNDKDISDTLKKFLIEPNFLDMTFENYEFGIN